MKERPILFSAPMVRAILAGTKTQTRRVIKAPDSVSAFRHFHEDRWDRMQGIARGDTVRCPYSQPGDRLWVREAFSGPWCMEAQDGIAAAPPSKWGESSEIWYWADGEPTYGDWTRPRPSIHMPRELSRITLEVTGVRVERLQGISEADAIAEGVSHEPRCLADDDTAAFNRIGPVANNSFPIARYAALWEQINGPGSWEANPWVWVIAFKRLEAA